MKFAAALLLLPFLIGCNVLASEAEPTPRPKPTATPNVGMMCAEIRNYLIKADALDAFYTSNIGGKNTRDLAPVDVAEYGRLAREANRLPISPPPEGASGRAVDLYSAVRTYQNALDNASTNLRALDATAFNRSNNDAKAARRDIDAYRAQVCP